MCGTLGTHYTTMDQKTEQYKKILSEIASERGLHELASYISLYGNKDMGGQKVIEVTELKQAPQYAHLKITKMPEAHCDGCE